jgi:hypothetical protein
MIDHDIEEILSPETAAGRLRELRRSVEEVVTGTLAVDMHTHLFAPQFGRMSLWGVDDLLTYHYLIEEFFRVSNVAPEYFWSLPRARQADLIWEAIFVRRTPLSEAARGVVTVFTALGLDPRAPDLGPAREYFKEQNVDDHLNRVLELAGVSIIVMTNDPLDAEEARVWMSRVEPDRRFRAALRMDRILNGWGRAAEALTAQGYEVDASLGGKTIRELRRFLDFWIGVMKPLYLAVSLPDDFTFPDDSPRSRLIRDGVLPACRDHGLPFALMIGVKRGVNPALRSAGDGLGRADVGALIRLCADHPDNRFLATFLSRENQHEMCVAARKFSNLMPFGCWWFLNNPSIVSEITRERIEMLGPSFIAQNSDARVLEQLIYKWRHARAALVDALYEAYSRLVPSGWLVTTQEIRRDAAQLLSDNFRDWVGLTDAPNGKEGPDGA